MPVSRFLRAINLKQEIYLEDSVGRSGHSFGQHLAQKSKLPHIEMRNVQPLNTAKDDDYITRGSKDEPSV